MLDCEAFCTKTHSYKRLSGKWQRLSDENGLKLLIKTDPHTHTPLCRHPPCLSECDPPHAPPPHNKYSDKLNAPFSCFLNSCLTCHREVDEPQKVHQFEGAADHQEDAYSLQPLHLPLVLEEQMHPFLSPLPLLMFTHLPRGDCVRSPPPPPLSLMAENSASPQSPSICQCSAIPTPCRSPPCFFSFLFSSHLAGLLFSLFLLPERQGISTRLLLHPCLCWACQRLFEFQVKFGQSAVWVLTGWLQFFFTLFVFFWASDSQTLSTLCLASITLLLAVSLPSLIGSVTGLSEGRKEGRNEKFKMWEGWWSTTCSFGGLTRWLATGNMGGHTNERWEKWKWEMGRGETLEKRWIFGKKRQQPGEEQKSNYNPKEDAEGREEEEKDKYEEKRGGGKKSVSTAGWSSYSGQTHRCDNLSWEWTHVHTNTQPGGEIWV